LGVAHGRLGQRDQEANAEQEAIRLNPDDTRAWFDLGIAYSALGQQSEVITVYERLKVLDQSLAEKFFRSAVLP
jgi:Flp pilus assembly protein TadD